jgi:hypothetical protein
MHGLPSYSIHCKSCSLCYVLLVYHWADYVSIHTPVVSTTPSVLQFRCLLKQWCVFAGSKQVVVDINQVPHIDFQSATLQVGRQICLAIRSPRTLKQRSVSLRSVLALIFPCMRWWVGRNVFPVIPRLPWLRLPGTRRYEHILWSCSCKQHGIRRNDKVATKVPAKPKNKVVILLVVMLASAVLISSCCFVALFLEVLNLRSEMSSFRQTEQQSAAVRHCHQRKPLGRYGWAWWIEQQHTPAKHLTYEY